jgi:hypothetical protein
MAMALELIPAGTRVETKGDGAALDVSGSATRTFLLTMEIAEVVEQQSLDVSIMGSADGTDFDKMPLLKLPQRFYRGQTRMVLDVSQRPEVKFIRAHWDVNRWGRVAPTPMFVLGLRAAEITAFPKASPKTAATA